jgi:hypothetical protein
MAFPVKQVRALEEPLCIIEEVEKTPSEKRTDPAKQLCLPPSTLNTIIVKKIRENACLWTRSSQRVVCCVEEMCGELGSGSCVEEVQGGGGCDRDDDDDDEAEFYGSTSCV